MTTNPNTRRAIIAAVAVVVVAGIALGAFLAGRSTTATPSPSPLTAAPSSESPSASYEPTDPNGSAEPGLPRGQAEAGAGGSTTGPAGLPLGYSHDETGAVNAATNYLMWMNSLKITNKNDADAMATAAAADDATRQALIESFDALRSGMSDMTRAEPEPARGAYAVADYSGQKALIYVWYPVVTESDGQTDNVWGVDAVSLAWSKDDWKLDEGLVTEVGAAAIDPSDPAGNPTATEKHSILSRIPADPGEITDSAEQSWIEYANAPH